MRWVSDKGCNTIMGGNACVHSGSSRPMTLSMYVHRLEAVVIGYVQLVPCETQPAMRHARYRQMPLP